MTPGATLNRIESTLAAHDRHWVFAGPREPILVVGLEPLLGHLHIVLSSWPHHGVGASAPRPADVLIELNGRSLRIRARTASRWESSLDTPVQAVVAVVGGLICASLVQMDGAVLLHAGAADVGKGLAILLGGSQAGKSSVGLQLAANGCRYFGDDRLIVEVGGDGAPAAATCLGLTPKVRLPLPESCGPGYRSFVGSHVFYRADQWVILRLEKALAAGFGDTRAVAALVVLERRREGPAALTPVSRVGSLTALLQSASSPALDTARVVRDMRELARKVPGYVLRFSDSAEAAAILEKELCGAAPES